MLNCTWWGPELENREGFRVPDLKSLRIFPPAQYRLALGYYRQKNVTRQSRRASHGVDCKTPCFTVFLEQFIYNSISISSSFQFKITEQVLHYFFNWMWREIYVEEYSSCCYKFTDEFDLLMWGFLRKPTNQSRLYFRDSLIRTFKENTWSLNSYVRIKQAVTVTAIICPQTSDRDRPKP